MASLAQMLIVGLYILSLNWLLLLACIRIFFSSHSYPVLPFNSIMHDNYHFYKICL